MTITIHLFYTGTDDAAQRFAKEMTTSGTVEAVRNTQGNLRYEYFQSINDPHTILLVDSWEDQSALDAHHESPLMQKITQLRDKYDLHMHVERLKPDDNPPDDEQYIRR